MGDLRQALGSWGEAEKKQAKEITREDALSFPSSQTNESLEQAISNNNLRGVTLRQMED